MDKEEFIQFGMESFLQLNDLNTLCNHKCGEDSLQLLIVEKAKDLMRDIDITKPRFDIIDDISLKVSKELGLRNLQKK